MFNMLCIAFICVVIIDRSGFIDNLKGFIARRLGYPFNHSDWRLHIIDCSFCCSWWMNLAYLIITGMLSIPMIAFALTLSLATPIINDIIVVITLGIRKLLGLILKKYE